MQVRKCVVWVCLCLIGATPNYAMPSLKVGVYRSFLGSYGPSQHLKMAFEKQCRCHLQWVGLGHGAELLRKGVKAGSVDIVMGFDRLAIWEYERKTGIYLGSLLEPIQADSKNQPSYAGSLHPYLLPYSIGVMTVIERQAKIYSPSLKKVETFIDFLAAVERNFFIQDPRTSTLGAGLLYWLSKDAKQSDRFLHHVALLKKASLGVGKSWSSSYGLFLKGEADYAFSYLTSEAYHRGIEDNPGYQAVFFKEALPAQIEFAARLKSSENEKLSKKFLEFLALPETQAYIAYRNVMLPFKLSLGKKLPSSHSILKPLGESVCRFEDLIEDSSLEVEQATCKRYIKSIPFPNGGQEVFFFPGEKPHDFHRYLDLWKWGMR